MKMMVMVVLMIIIAMMIMIIILNDQSMGGELSGENDDGDAENHRHGDHMREIIITPN